MYKSELRLGIGVMLTLYHYVCTTCWWCFFWGLEGC